jgi:hypothetical protein
LAYASIDLSFAFIQHVGLLRRFVCLKYFSRAPDNYVLVNSRSRSKLFAQESIMQGGTISGVVKDETGAAVGGAEVSA